MWTQAMLELRPTNVMHQLGTQSRVPVLNAKDLLFGLSDTDALFWMPRVERDEDIVGAIRAASHCRSPLGLSIFADKDISIYQHEHPPAKLVWKSSEHAKKLAFIPPLCFHAQLPPIDSTVDSELNAAANFILACVEAGYTSFGLDLASSRAGDDFSWVLRVLSPVLDFELAYGVCLDFSQESDPGAVLEGLGSAGLSPDVVLLSNRSRDVLDTEPFLRFFRDNPDLVPAWLGESVPGSTAPIKVSIGESLSNEGGAQNADGDENDLRMEARAYTKTLVRLKRLGLKGVVDHLAARLVDR